MQSTILIADDHALSGEGIRSILAPLDHIKILDIANNGIEAITLIRKNRPDCALIDLVMPGANGLDVLIDAKRWSPNTKVVIITGNSSPKQFQLLKDAGVDGILLKNSAPEKIIANVQSVLDGNFVFPDEVRKIIEESDNKRPLTKRELEVLVGVSKGLSNQKISDMLGISHKTVDTHRTNLMRKFEVNSTPSLLLKAMREGYLEV